MLLVGDSDGGGGGRWWCVVNVFYVFSLFPVFFALWAEDDTSISVLCSGTAKAHRLHRDMGAGAGMGGGDGG